MAMYQQALRHRSAIPDDQPDVADNERLEFLGDAVLGAIVGQFLFERYPDRGEGFLTRMRSKLVSRHQLSILAKRVEIERVMEVNIANDRHTSVPGNAIEALIGALFLDKGFVRTRKAVIKLFTTHFDLLKVEQEDRDSKSRLLEWGQKQHRKVEFILSESASRGRRGKQFTAEVRVDGKACGAGTGYSKKRAEQEAAREASHKLGLGKDGRSSSLRGKQTTPEGKPENRRRRPRRRKPGTTRRTGTPTQKREKRD